MRTYTLPRVPEHLELRRALEKMPRAVRYRLLRSILENLKIDLATALEADDPETLSVAQRRAVGQRMQDSGAAFMVGPLTANA